MDRRFLPIALAVTAAALLAGCAATYVPLSWGMRDRIDAIVAADPLLLALYSRHDPKGITLRPGGVSFSEVLDPGQGSTDRIGAYRSDTQLLYRNLEVKLDDRGLRNLLVHELAHHVWYRRMTPKQKLGWQEHLRNSPSRWQPFVRKNYPDSRLHAAEDFAYTVEFAGTADIEALAELDIIGRSDARRLLERVPQKL